ncbi:ChrR family anti-sigma-E factor [Aquabacter cavernae]|uniref:ChrR family anti-sigma-E factor n=1 Tax=Aquabacter cavernae TaxID=2496029 RepID=UPI001FDF5D78|nr:ChrR family anti-sigma-E factor [Aquabacter cavernae]
MSPHRMRPDAISHHITDATLLRYATGRLPAGPALVVSVHLEGCPACRAKVAAFEAVGGALLDEAPPELMAPDALARLLARIDGDAPAEPQPLRKRPARKRPVNKRPLPDFPGDLRVPSALRACEVGPWRWMGPGMRMSRVDIPGAPGSGAILLRIGPGRSLPEHGHGALELTQVLSGSFSDEMGRYQPGDVSETDEDVDHTPVVDGDGECICLVALEGGMLFRGLMGRLIQPFVRF